MKGENNDKFDVEEEWKKSMQNSCPWKFLINKDKIIIFLSDQSFVDRREKIFHCCWRRREKSDENAEGENKPPEKKTQAIGFMRICLALVFYFPTIFDYDRRERKKKFEGGMSEMERRQLTAVVVKCQ